jgi:hypothetical protein
MSAIACYDDDRDWVEVELTKGHWAKVSVEDLGKVIGWPWQYGSSKRGAGYVARHGPSHDKRKILMHRMILGLADDDRRQVDHKNHDPTDNRRTNLRVATQSQNLANQPKRRDSTLQFKGVHHSPPRRWAARIRVNGKRRHLGMFDTEIAAARAYNAAAKQAWAEYALLNDV